MDLETRKTNRWTKKRLTMRRTEIKRQVEAGKEQGEKVDRENSKESKALKTEGSGSASGSEEDKGIMG